VAPVRTAAVDTNFLIADGVRHLAVGAFHAAGASPARCGLFRRFARRATFTDFAGCFVLCHQLGLLRIGRVVCVSDRAIVEE
jgi:hypothetical protein